MVNTMVSAMVNTMVSAMVTVPAPVTDLLDTRGKIIAGVDTEGSTDNVWSVQLSMGAGTGYTIRGHDTDAIDLLIVWLRSNRDRALVSLHHSLHDIPVLKSAGIDLAGDEIAFLDTMVLAYLLGIEPQGLKSLCFRHAGMHQDSYDDVIGDTGHRLAMEYLRRVDGAEDAPLVEVVPKGLRGKRKRKKKGDPEGSGDSGGLDNLGDPPPPLAVFVHSWPDPEPETIWEQGRYQIKKFQGVGKLVRRTLSDIESGKTLKDGSPVDPIDRWKKLRPSVKRPVIDAIGDMPAPTLDDIEPGRAVRYASRDSDAQFRITQPLIDRVKAMGLQEACRIDHGIIPMIVRMGEVGIKLAPAEFWDNLDAKCVAQMDRARWRIFQRTGRDINPGSGDQVAELLYGPKSEGGMGLIPPRMTDGGESGEVRGSTNDKCLEELLPLAPVVEDIESYREASKIKGTYGDPLRLMATTGDGRARATFKLTRQVTGRISTAEPMNLLSIPVRSELGNECRYGFVAPDGKILHDADLSQVEMRTFAHLSRDEKLCRIFIEGAKLRGDEKKRHDIHVLTAAEMFSVPVPMVEKYQRQAAKQVGFGIINGISPYGLNVQMILYRATRKDGSRWTEDDCDQMIREWFRIYPGARRFQIDCVEETRATGLARDPLSGRIRYLPQIWSPVDSVRAEAERCSYSHLIQTSANTILKRALMAMWGVLKGVDGYEPLLPVHDEVLSEVPLDAGVMDMVDEVVKWALTSTTKLIVPLEAESGFGMSWGEAH